LPLFYEYDNESLGTIKGKELVGQLSNCEILKKGSALWGWLIS